MKRRVLVEPVDVKLNRKTLVKLKLLKHALRKGTIEEVVDALIKHYEATTGKVIAVPPE